MDAEARDDEDAKATTAIAVKRTIDGLAGVVMMEGRDGRTLLHLSCYESQSRCSYSCDPCCVLRKYDYY